MGPRPTKTNEDVHRSRWGRRPRLRRTPGPAAEPGARRGSGTHPTACVFNGAEGRLRRRLRCGTKAKPGWPDRTRPAVELKFSARLPRHYPRNRASTACGAELACAMAAREACCNTCDLVRFDASSAKSASRIRDSVAEKLVICELARLMA